MQNEWSWSLKQHIDLTNFLKSDGKSSTKERGKSPEHQVEKSWSYSMKGWPNQIIIYIHTLFCWKKIGSLFKVPDFDRQLNCTAHLFFPPLLLLSPNLVQPTKFSKCVQCFSLLTIHVTNGWLHIYDRTCHWWSQTAMYSI